LPQKFTFATKAAQNLLFVFNTSVKDRRREGGGGKTGSKDYFVAVQKKMKIVKMLILSDTR